MAFTLQQILGWNTLTGVINAKSTGVPDVLPPAFKSLTKPVIRDAAEYLRVLGTRKTARLAMYGSPAVRRDLSGITSIPVKLLHTNEELLIDFITYQNLRAYNDYGLQDMGREELTRQMQQFGAVFDNLRISAIMSMLLLGKIYFDGTGNLLPTSSGAKVTVDYGINANNQNQINGTLGTTWSNTAADIPGDIRKLKKLALRLTGYPLRHVFYGESVPGYFEKNTSMQLYLTRNPKMNDQYLTSAELPDGLLGLTWHPIYTSFFEDQSGSNQSFVNAASCVFTPEITRDVYEILEGSYPVPTTFQPVNMANGDIPCELVHGRGGYAVPCSNPPTANVYMFDTFLPIWKVPDAIFQAIVNF